MLIGPGEPLTLHHRLANALERLLVDGVVRGVSGHRHRARQVDAGAEHRGEHATGALDDRGLGEVTNHRHLEYPFGQASLWPFRTCAASR